MIQPRRASIVHRSDRCDECRRRKRGCDKLKPACSGCLDRKVICQYSRQAQPFINLHAAIPARSLRERALASTDTTSKSNGRTGRDPLTTLSSTLSQLLPERQPFFMRELVGESRADAFTWNQEASWYRQAPYKIESPIVHYEARLAGELYQVLHSARSPGSRMHLWGDWLGYIPRRVSMTRDALLTRAVECLVLGHHAVHTQWSESTIAMGRRHYGHALIVMRELLEAHVAVTADMIAAVKMLMMFELLIGTGISGWLPHASVYADLFLILGPQSCTGDFERALFHATHVTAWQQALMTGKPSKFDKPEWLNIPPPRGLSTSYFVAEKLVACRLKATVRLPRLITLVRKLRSEPENVLILEKAVKLAGELLGLLWLEDSALQPKLQLRRTSITSDAHHVPFSFHCSESDFHRLIHQTLHWSSKIILGGLCERICAQSVPAGWPNLSEIRDTNRICADSICMSIEMAVRLAPYGPVRLFGPMFVAWGAYWGQQRTAADDSLRAKMDWLRQKGNELLASGSGNLHPIHDIALMFMNDRMQGGPMSTADYLAQGRVTVAARDKATRHSQIMVHDASSSLDSSISTQMGQKSSERGLENIF